MKHFYIRIQSILSLFLLAAAMPAMVEAQSKVMQVHSEGSVMYEINTSQVDSITFKLPSNIVVINENEFAIMQAMPKKAPIGSSIKLKIENHTTYTMSCGQSYSLEYFNKSIWEPFELNCVFEFVLGSR